MIRIHRSFLYTPPIRIISVVFVVGILLFLLSIVEYDKPASWLEFHQEQQTYEYLLQGFTIIKLMLVLYISFIWMYATRWNEYDVYVLIRSSKQRVQWSRFVVLVELSGICMAVVTVLFIAVQMLYPYAISVSYVWSLVQSMVLFILYYNALMMCMERLIPHLVGLFLPLILYLVTLLQGDVIRDQSSIEGTTDVWHIIAPDVVFDSSVFGFVMGPFWMILVTIIVLQITYYYVQKVDGLR